MHLGKLGRAWDMGKRLTTASGELNVTPWDALLGEVRRSAYRSTWLDQRLDDEVSRDSQLAHEDAGDGAEERRKARAEEVRRWLDASRKERVHLARISKMAVDAGLAERYVRSVEIEARLIARVIERSIGVLELTDEQKRAVALKLREELESVSLELRERHVAVAALPHRDSA